MTSLKHKLQFTFTKGDVCLANLRNRTLLIFLTIISRCILQLAYFTSNQSIKLSEKNFPFTCLLSQLSNEHWESKHLGWNTNDDKLWFLFVFLSLSLPHSSIDALLQLSNCPD